MTTLNENNAKELLQIELSKLAVMLNEQDEEKYENSDIPDPAHSRSSSLAKAARSWSWRSM